MPVKTLYLHVGMPKAGSTSIQRAFHSTPSVVERHGVHYPAFHWNHSRPIVAIIERPEDKTLTLNGRQFIAPLSPADFEQIRTEVEADLESDASIHVLSGETFQRFSPESCRRLRDFLSRYYSDIRVIFYARHPFPWASSRAQFSLKRYQRTLASQVDPQRIADGSTPILPLYGRVQAYREVFGAETVDIRPFDRSAFAGGDLLMDFCTAIGRPALGPDLVGSWANQGYRAEAVHILDRYVSRTAKEHRHRFAAIRQVLEPLPGSAFSLDRATLAAVWRRSAGELEWLHGAMGRTVFEEAYPKEADEDPAWGPETIEALSAIIGRRISVERDRSGQVAVHSLDRICDGLERVSQAPAAKVFDLGRLRSEAILESRRLRRKALGAVRSMFGT